MASPTIIIDLMT